MQLFSSRTVLLGAVCLLASAACAATVPAASTSPENGPAHSSVASPAPIHSSVDGPIKLADNGPLSTSPKTGQSGNNALTITGLGGGSTQWTIVVLLTFLTLIPSILICMTPFARLLIVFHFLRQALGLQTTPSNQTLVGLSHDHDVLPHAARSAKPSLKIHSRCPAASPANLTRCRSAGPQAPCPFVDLWPTTSATRTSPCSSISPRSRAQRRSEDLSFRVLLARLHPV